MRIRRVRIQGFRCLRDVEVPFDHVTTLIGPNGVGKSSILRALDWFFNGTALLQPSVEDLNPDAPDRRIRVEVEFDTLTREDRAQLGKYAPDGADRVVLWRTWDDGEDVFSGNARAYPGFAHIRSAQAAMERRSRYAALRTDQPELELPPASNVAQVDDALASWEGNHPADLADSEIETSTKFFGFLGGAKLSGLFDYVFVGADLRASDEADGSRTATIGRLLERTIDRTVALSKFDALLTQLRAEQDAIVEEHLADQLEILGADLTHSVNQFTTGREVQLEVVPTDTKIQPLQFSTRIADGDVVTSVAGQGHGFQRALLISALKMVAERGRRNPTSGTMLLAIEEPELYQHPTQARAFASTLRALAEDATQAVQAVYATHSPMFIEPGRFHQLRRLRRVNDGTSTHTAVVAGSSSDVVDALTGVMSEEKTRRQIDKACPQQLAEAVFADAVVLVEGETDRAIFEAIARRDGDILNRNVSIIDVSGKDSIPLCRGILHSLGVGVVMVADNDVDHRLAPGVEGTRSQLESEQRARASNRRLLRCAGEPAMDWPPDGPAGDSLIFFAPNLETWLRTEWPEWELARQALIANEAGYGGKHARTYFNAATDSATDPPGALGLVLQRALAFSSTI